MLAYLINVVDNTWLLALFAPIALFVGRRGDSPRRWRAIALGALALGLAAALTYAILKRNTGWVVREYYDIAILWPALLAFALFAALLWGSLRRGAKLPARILAGILLALMVARAGPNLFTYPLDFDVGLDSVFNMDYLAKATGYLAGILLSLLAYVALGAALKKTPSRALYPLILISLIIFFLFLAVDAARVMYVRGMFPRYKWIPGLVIDLMRGGRRLPLAILLVWTFGSFALIYLSYATRPKGDNPALVRKSRKALRLQFQSGAFLLLTLLAIGVTLTYLRFLDARGPVISEPERVGLSAGLIRLDLEVVGDGDLHRYEYATEDGTLTRFIVIRKSATAFGVGLDACDICGPTGYYQRGDQVVCKLCDVVMNKSTIGFPGGCNPVPLAYAVAAGQLTIDPMDLESEKRRFR
ncbi:MAG: DUF2318 domain-containing protein [Deltaproteobacteria bacterium]|jgi:uncharacterized membrane protein|nr:DUF2318 domain-containing protein [Deltaproteobacteria bacterium]